MAYSFATLHSHGASAYNIPDPLLASGKSLVRLSRDEIHARLDERAKEAEQKQ